MRDDQEKEIKEGIKRVMNANLKDVEEGRIDPPPFHLKAPIGNADSVTQEIPQEWLAVLQDVARQYAIEIEVQPTTDEGSVEVKMSVNMKNWKAFSEEVERRMTGWVRPENRPKPK